MVGQRLLHAASVEQPQLAAAKLATPDAIEQVAVVHGLHDDVVPAKHERGEDARHAGAAVQHPQKSAFAFGVPYVVGARLGHFERHLATAPSMVDAARHVREGALAKHTDELVPKQDVIVSTKPVPSVLCVHRIARAQFGRRWPRVPHGRVPQLSKLLLLIARKVVSREVI